MSRVMLYIFIHVIAIKRFVNTSKFIQNMWNGGYFLLIMKLKTSIHYRSLKDLLLEIRWLGTFAWISAKRLCVIASERNS